MSAKGDVLAALEEEVARARQLVVATPADHPEHAERLDNLGLLLSKKYSRTSSLPDLEEAIQAAKQAVEIVAAKNYSEHSSNYLTNLGSRYGDRFVHTANLDDLQTAIETTRSALAIAAQNGTDRIATLSNFAILLADKFTMTGDINDLDEAIRIIQQVIEATPSGHSSLAGRLNSLAFRLGERFARTGDNNDLEESIRIARQAVQKSPQHDYNRARRLNNLGNRLGDRFTRFGSSSDLDEAIDMARQAIDITDDNYPERPQYLNNLGVRLGDRFVTLGALGDLDEAIQRARQAVAATSQTHIDLGQHLGTLGFLLEMKFDRYRAIADLDEAITTTRNAIAHTPQNHIDRARHLNNLGNQLKDRFCETNHLTNVNEAIGIMRQSMKTTPKTSSNYAGRINNLGNMFWTRFHKNKQMNDLDKAIRKGRQAINATADGHPDQAKNHFNLAVRLEYRFAKTGLKGDIEEALANFCMALNYDSAIISVRLRAGQYLLRSPHLLEDTNRALQVSQTTIDLLPRLAPYSLPTPDKQHSILRAANAASNAAAIALALGCSPATATAWLETGRGILASTVRNMRADLSELRLRHPLLAKSFEDNRILLDAPRRYDLFGRTDNDGHSTGWEIDQRLKACDRFEKTILEIRNQPDFERFLLPPSGIEMIEAVGCGTIVLINVSLHRCDALIIQRAGIQHLPLLQVSEQHIKRRSSSRLSFDTLQWLWDSIVDPILTLLGFTRSPTDGKWPRIWWIPTGSLVGMPLHAAGYHSRKTGRTTLDRVISSYATSIRAIRHSRRQIGSQSTTEQTRSMVLVAMQITRGLKSKLHYAREEIELIEKFAPSLNLSPIQPTATKKEVLAALNECDIFHFAGHGETHPSLPLQSRLLLEDWIGDPLTVGSLLETNLQQHSPFLAYLSACGTGQIEDERSVDESIHLIAACQMAGFRHVIGTLWEVADESCKEVAERTYRIIANAEMTEDSVSIGLHHAVRYLRQRNIDLRSGKRGGGRPAYMSESSSEDDEQEYLSWVPYVHFGL